MSVQQICTNQTGGGGQNIISGNNSNCSNLPVPHSQSAHEIGGQIPLTPLAQHQQALHQQLQMRFANSNNNSGEFIDFFHFDFFLNLINGQRIMLSVF